MIRPLCLAVLLALAPLLPAWAADVPSPASARGTNTGLPVPRFVSLGADRVNVRAGPGDRYPIAWQFQRRSLPVEITAEFDYWRRIRDIDGAEGWVHKNLLNGRRFALVTGTTRSLFAEPSRNAAVVLQAEAGVQGRLLACRTGWCRLEIEKRRGWLPQDELWGVYPGEVIE